MLEIFILLFLNIIFLLFNKYKIAVSISLISLIMIIFFFIYYIRTDLPLYF